MLRLQHFAGKPASELEKTPVFDLFADDIERAKARDIFARYGREGVHDCEFFLRAGDGSTVPVSMNCTPRLSQTGKLMGMVVTGRPVGELRRAYQALRQAHDDLKRTQSQLLHAEKMVSLGRLVAGVAHELNNPISFVLGNVLSLRRYANASKAIWAPCMPRPRPTIRHWPRCARSCASTASWPTCRT
jgi:two-component system sensor histidine kinase HupT/HoxJ